MLKCVRGIVAFGALAVFGLAPLVRVDDEPDLVEPAGAAVEGLLPGAGLNGFSASCSAALANDLARC